MEELAGNEAPHISHLVRDGWFTNVQRGQGSDPPGPRDQLLLDCTIFCAKAGDKIEFGEGEPWIAAALIAALRTVVNGGLIPHARQEGRLVAALAVAGSKLDGIGFENVQMGHIHVALARLEDVEPWGRLVSDCVGWRVDCWGAAGLDVVFLVESVFFFCGLGYIMSLGEDFKKPACRWGTC